MNTAGNGQIIIIFMVTYCAWNRHNNLSSRALLWHTYHHDVFAYIVDISFLNILKDRYIAVHKEEKIQVSLSSSVVRKGIDLQCVHCAIRPSASLTRHYRHHVKGGSAHETRNKAEDSFSLRGDITRQSEDAEVLSLHSQISKSIIFKQKPFIYNVFLWCDGSLKFVLSEKNIGKNLIISDR